jgi:hypothetical protein
MNIRANTNPMYLGKFLLIGLFATAFGLYHLYDAVFKYPAAIPVAEAYEALDDGEISDGDLQRNWKAFTQERGWPEDEPKKVEELKYFINYNYLIGIIFTALIGIPCFVFALLNYGAWFEWKDGQLTNRKGQTVDLDQITKIDKTKWEKKGITRLEYKDGEATKHFVIDDLKFDRNAADQIMAMVEQKVGVDKIVGGKSEAVYQELKEARAAEKKARDEEEMAEMEED